MTISPVSCGDPGSAESRATADLLRYGMIIQAGIAVGLAVVALVAGTAATPSRAQQPGARACASPADPVQEEGFVTLGGIEQWITINGERCGNPVVLFLHGGPGNTLSPYAGELFGHWRSSFTLVQWDQRGAGRTFGRNPRSADSTLTVDRMTQDGVEVAEYLVEHLRTPKVIVVAGSWGSILGVHMVKARPDLFAAYVGFAQFVSYRENQPASYAKVMALARGSNDEASIAALEKLGSPPWKDPRSYGILRRITRRYESKATDAAPAAWWERSPKYDSEGMRESYTAGEDFSYLQFVGLQGDGMLSRIDLPALGTTFEVPVYIVQGAEDLVTVPEVATQYFERISAPAKQFVLVPRAGHDPNRGLLDAVFTLVRRAASRGI